MEHDTKLSGHLLNKSHANTRLKIGLKWDQRRINTLEKVLSFNSTFLANKITLLLWIPITLLGLLIFKKPKLPSLLSRKTYEQSTAKYKHEDSSSSRENNYNQYDLDLCCYTFDDQKNCLLQITPDPNNLINEDVSIYHSGEEFTGGGVHDDETIYIDINKFDNRHKTLLIVVVSDCKFSFSELDNIPQVRVVDSKFEKNLLNTDIPVLTDLAHGKYVYVHSKLINDSQEWRYQLINEFYSDTTDLIEKLKTYI